MMTLLEKKYFVPIVLLLWTLIMEMLCNVDSYLYAQTAQFDSAVFYMSGKALISGMTPYVDFSDSKGILLWLIYGIGYLFDNYSYVGVFWISCLFMWVTLIIGYKTARLWTGRKVSLLSAMILITPLLFWNVNFETKTEHFCWPFVMYGLYSLMKSMVKRRNYTKDCFIVAVSVVACIMIKWSIAVMMLSIVQSIGWWSIRNRSVKQCVLGLCSGIIVGALPFIVYFSMTGLWDVMIQEYFCNTMSSVSVPLSELIDVYAGEWLNVLTSKRIMYLLFALVYLLLWNKKDWFASALPFLCALCFLAISIRHDNFGYYTAIVGPFAIYAIVRIVDFIFSKRHGVILASAFCMLLSVYDVQGAIRFRDNFCTKAEHMDKFASISYAMSTVGKSSVIIIGEDRGLAMASTFPGTKYWMTQMGATEQMLADQDAAIERGTADFVIYLWKTDKKDYDKILNNAGYHILADSKDGVVYTKHDIQMPKFERHFTARDIIMKKTYIEKYEQI